MKYNFIDVYVSKEKRFSIGRESNTGKYYLSFPVRNQLAEYEEYYEISKIEYENFLINTDKIDILLSRARMRFLKFQ